MDTSSVLRSTTATFFAMIDPLDRSFYARTLCRGQCRLQVVRRVAAVMHAVAVLPLTDGLLGRAEPFCKDRGRLIAGLDCRPYLWCRRRLLVKMNQHGPTPPRLAGKQSPGLFSPPPHSLKTDLAMKNAERRGSM
jgi:hypothetical protein